MKTFAQLKTFLSLSAAVVEPAIVSEAEQNLMIRGLSNHTDLIEAGWGFVALPGERHHGKRFWQQAKDQGALCVISDQTIDNCSLPVLVVENLDQHLAELANWFYDFPSEQIGVIGITGTNGKTSTTHYLAQLLTLQNEKVGLIGTLGNGEFGELVASVNTTPDILVVQHWLARFVEQGFRWALLEVSSHGLALGRIKGIKFACVGLTQVTRDHLDFHRDEADYQATKQRLFNEYETQYRVVNLDDPVGRKIADHQACFGYSMQELGDLTNTLGCRDLKLTPQGLQAELVYQQTELSNHQACFAPLMGRFNAENLMCAVSCLISVGFKFETLISDLAKLSPVLGRMQKVEVTGKSVTALVDYAHTPDALQQVLQAMRAHLNHGKLWVVFGCGGDRDKGKRPLMGAVAERYADRVVVTSDNPRTENPAHIIQEILQGMQNQSEQIILRQPAIEWALNQAEDGDLVLVAGKGHEHYQDIQGVRYPFSDQEVIEAWRK